MCVLLSYKKGGQNKLSRDFIINVCYFNSVYNSLLYTYVARYNNIIRVLCIVYMYIRWYTKESAKEIF